MAKYLIDKDLLIGKTSVEVKTILNDNSSNSVTGYLMYDLGNQRGGFGIDHDWLRIYFDDMGRVESARIAPD